jgi:CRP/FNR family transcriptional regulator, polysaccharide utilization system transcription regulator
MGLALKNNCVTCKCRSDIFNALNEEDIAKVEGCRVSVVYNQGETIFKQGTPCNNFVCVTSGLVKIYLEHENNNNIMLGLVRPVNYIFDPGVFIDQRHRFSATACEETSACLIDVKLMKEFLVNNSEFANMYINKVSYQTVDLFNKISNCSQKNVFGRVADILLYLHNNIYQVNPFKLTISRQDIADLSGTTKESSIRVLKKFKEDNIILIEGNNVEILNLAMLEAISKNG